MVSDQLSKWVEISFFSKKGITMGKSKAIDYTCIFNRKSNKKTKKYIEFYTYQ
jgi:hypothetical protein